MYQFFFFCSFHYNFFGCICLLPYARNCDSRKNIFFNGYKMNQNDFFLWWNVKWQMWRNCHISERTKEKIYLSPIHFIYVSSLSSSSIFFSLILLNIIVISFFLIILFFFFWFNWWFWWSTYKVTWIIEIFFLNVHTERVWADCGYCKSIINIQITARSAFFLTIRFDIQHFIRKHAKKLPLEPPKYI